VKLQTCLTRAQSPFFDRIPMPYNRPRAFARNIDPRHEQVRASVLWGLNQVCGVPPTGFHGLLPILSGDSKPAGRSGALRFLPARILVEERGFAKTLIERVDALNQKGPLSL
jgi:hypothetical protein